MVIEEVGLSMDNIGVFMSRKCIRNSQGGTIFFGGFPRWVSTFISKVIHDLKQERRSLWNCHTALLCLVVWVLFMVRLVHMKRRWRHVSVTCNVGPPPTYIVIQY